MSSVEFKKNVELIDKYDVIVAGGGPSGCAAAAASARRGAKTLLIEGSGALGGMGTGGMVPTWCPFSDGENIVYRGIALEVFEKAKQHVEHIPKESLDWVSIEPESLKIVYDDLVTESGADILFNTMVLDIITDGSGTVTELIAGNKSGIIAFRAKSYIDCTGDADVAVRAGAEYTVGDRDGNLQSATLCFQLSNVNDYKYSLMKTLNGSNNPDSRVHDMQKDKDLPLIDCAHMCSSLVGPSTVGFNSMHLDVDGTDPQSVSKGLILGRKKAQEVKKGLVKYYPEAFGGSYVSATASLMGVRESRIIKGEYTLTVMDYAQRRTFEDEICRNSYYLDIHSACSDLENFESVHYESGESHGIPYRCLVPKKVLNVIVAGRTISCDRAVQGSVRVMPVCLAMGEAAGYAAYIAARDGKAFKDVDVNEVRGYLFDNGAYIV